MQISGADGADRPRILQHPSSSTYPVRDPRRDRKRYRLSVEVALQLVAHPSCDALVAIGGQWRQDQFPVFVKFRAAIFRHDRGELMPSLCESGGRQCIGVTREHVFDYRRPSRVTVSAAPVPAFTPRLRDEHRPSGRPRAAGAGAPGRRSSVRCNLSQTPVRTPRRAARPGSDGDRRCHEFRAAATRSRAASAGRACGTRRRSPGRCRRRRSAAARGAARRPRRGRCCGCGRRPSRRRPRAGSSRRR